MSRLQRRMWIATNIALLLLIIGAEPRCTAVSTQTACLETAQLRPHARVVVVNPSSICVPEGVFVAVRNPHWKGVVRFTEVRDVDEARLEGCSRYEIHARDDRNGRFTLSMGVVSSFGSAGVHPVVVERGRQTMAAPGFSVRYRHPGCLSLLAGRELEVAPTPWRTMEDVDLDDARLQWYSRDTSGTRRLAIPLDALELLWGGDEG